VVLDPGFRRDDGQTAATSFFLPKRLRATSAAAAPPKSRIIGGAGTGSGPPDEPVEPLDP
jgi:hypothetical protein